MQGRDGPRELPAQWSGARLEPDHLGSSPRSASCWTLLTSLSCEMEGKRRELQSCREKERGRAGKAELWLLHEELLSTWVEAPGGPQVRGGAAAAT